LKNPQDENILDVEKNVFELNQAKKELVIMSQDEKMRELYEMRQASLHDRVSALGGAFRKGYKKAFKLVEKAEKEKEKAEKEKEKAEKEKEKAEKEKEKAEKEKEKAEKGKEKAEKEKEKERKTFIKMLLSSGVTKEKIAETLNISIEMLEEYL
jgi:penicillin-binding protein 2A